jgi:hypothetical protein
MEQVVSQQNWAAGELSAKMRGRHELPIYQSGAERIVNFVTETSGPARFRSGFQFVFGTRRYQPAWLWPFQFNDSDAYEMEFTTGYVRFYRNGGIITLPSQNISGGVTKANPGVVTVASHGLSNGTEVIVNGVVGMVQLNNRSFVIANVTTNTFTLQDNFGNDIDTTLFTTYTSGGTITPVYEVKVPYNVVDVPQLKLAQNADVVEFVHRNYEPVELTRLGDANWSAALFSRTDDPCGAQISISAITQANPAQVTATGHGYLTGQQIIINAVVGMTPLNNFNGGGYFTITKVDADNFTLNGVDSTGYPAYSSGGYTMDKTQLVAAIAYYQGRKYYGYSDTYPESIWGSKPLDSSGNPQYNDFTLGATAADAFKFTLSPISAKVDKIQSLVPSLNFLAINTFEGISKADGDSAGDPISPSTINITPVVTAGCLQQITPFLLGITMLYVHRSGLIFYSLEYDIFYNAYNAMDKDLSCDQWSQSPVVGGSGVIQMVYQVSRPTAFWFVRNDGVLIGRTYMVKENINGIHRHLIGGNSPKVLSAGIMPRGNAYDQLWIVSQRVVNGHTVCFVEYANDDIIIPELDDYCTGDANQVTDTLTWKNAMFEAQKQYVYVDAALTYDGSLLGLNAGATLTPAAVTGNSVAFTASQAVFTASMVGQQLWKQSQNGVGVGRAVILAYVSSTQVTCQILTPFDNVTAMPAGQWYLTTAVVSGIWHLNGELVDVMADGGDASPVNAVTDGFGRSLVQVVNGSITLQYQASVVHVGEPYSGLLRSMAFEPQSQEGPTVARKKNINRLGIKFLNTLGARYGTSLYDMSVVQFASQSDLMGRPSPLFSGVKSVVLQDNTDYDKHVYIQQVRPLPCNVECIIPFVDTDDE